MKIGIISDTHGNAAAFDRALEIFGEADLIVHAGDVLYHPPRMTCGEGYDIPALVERINTLDIPMLIAEGNCDAQVYEELLTIPLQSPYFETCRGNIVIAATHGHLMSNNAMINLAHRNGIRFFVSGHTHVPVIREEDGVVLINPGSPSIPKAAFEGVLTPTVATLDDTGTVKLIALDGRVLIEKKFEV
ncbi:MAG: phosphodiesterase [Abditibacteriota bacterium]|nr:phosphodiesterase [Abditibacteriota bacterium]MBP5738241.1 phosphodiesterase [Abditibacteriota bacterium]